MFVIREYKFNYLTHVYKNIIIKEISNFLIFLEK